MDFKNEMYQLRDLSANIKKLDEVLSSDSKDKRDVQKKKDELQMEANNIISYIKKKAKESSHYEEYKIDKEINRIMSK